MGWALLLFCPAIISQPKHFAQKNSSTQINLLGKVETSKTSKSFFLELLHPKNFIRKLIVGTIAKDIVQGIIWGAKPWRYKGISTKRWKKSKKTKEHFSKPKPYSAMKYQKGKTIALFRHSTLIKKKEIMIMNTRIANVVQATLWVSVTNPKCHDESFSICEK